MNETINDKRYQKTDYAIRVAFWKLLKEKGFKKISVQDIIRECDINRSTFYSHYCDKYALLEALEDNAIRDINEMIESVMKEIILTHAVTDDDLKQYLYTILSYFRENGEKFLLILDNDESSTLEKKLRKYISEIWEKTNISRDMRFPPKYAIAAMSSMVTALIVEWIKSDFEYTTEEFTSYVFQMTGFFVRELTNVSIENRL